MKKKQSGITLVALVITIVILLILAGVAIASLGENGLLARAKEAKQAQIEAEMKEKLELAIQELQIEKLGGATLDDITQEWLNEKIKDYDVTIQDDPITGGKKVTMKDNGVKGIFIIDEKLNITKIENEDGSLDFTYEVGERNGESVKITIKAQDEERGISKIEILNKETITPDEPKGEISIEHEVQLGEECTIIITLANGEIKEKTIIINEYYHKITKNFSEGIKIDNTAVKAAYNQPYQATITSEGEYIIDTLIVTMGGETVTADTATGVINIEKVTGDIEIKATAKKLQIQTTTPIINTSTTATKSLGANTQTWGTILYINFKATSNAGTECTITINENGTVPYQITTNGTYKFTIKTTYQNITVTKELEVTVNQYQTIGGFVQYDAGDWTQEEIEELQNQKLYDINTSHAKNGTYKLKDDSGLNCTFGGFTYAKDKDGNDNPDASIAGVITSRNQSATNSTGKPAYEGWQILESSQENGKIYITKIVHAGLPENFVFYTPSNYDGYYAEYILSNGERQTSYKTLSDGTVINPRNWDMYKDKTLKDKGYIQEVHAMTYDEVFKAWGDTNKSSNGIINTKSWYWLADSYSYTGLCRVRSNGTYDYYTNNNCYGIRPVVQMVDGVYIASGDGSKDNPYVLGKD